MESAVQKPVFGMCQVREVKDYVCEALPDFCRRLDLNDADTLSMTTLGLESVEAASKIIETSCKMGEVAPLNQARLFWLELGRILVHQNSHLVGEHHLQAAMDHLESGGNVLLIQNHRSGADTLLLETLVNRYYGHDATSNWAYMSGHAVNLFLLPLMFTAAVRRFQIFSAKYQSLSLPGIADDNAMNNQNARALRSLSRHCDQGGKLIGLYPEGGRGDTCMKRGESKASCIFKLLARRNKPLITLPTYVDGSTNILPVVRGKNEYNEVFFHARIGTGTLSIGKPISWNELTELASRLSTQLNQPEEQSICDAGLALVAQLAPNEAERGPYANIIDRDARSAP